MKRIVIALGFAILGCTLFWVDVEAAGQYIVQPGDSLSKIAQRHGAQIQTLVALNSIHDPDLIFPGQVIKLDLVNRPRTYSIATWYGEDFHGNIMANGETYNMYDSTICASNWWPLGTWLEVKHGRLVVTVQVRDRGAFSHALDLSYASFNQLADPNIGVIQVEISVLDSLKVSEAHP